MKVVRLFINMITVIVTILFIVYVIAMLPNLFGYKSLIVKFSSMEPTYPKNSIVYYHSANINEISVGDIVTYKYGNDVLSSRVIKVENDTLKIRDDNKKEAGIDTVNKNDILGKNINIILRFIGPFVILVQENVYIACSIIVGIVLINILFQVFKKKKKVLEFE